MDPLDSLQSRREQLDTNVRSLEDYLASEPERSAIRRRLSKSRLIEARMDGDKVSVTTSTIVGQGWTMAEGRTFNEVEAKLNKALQALRLLRDLHEAGSELKAITLDYIPTY